MWRKGDVLSVLPPAARRTRKWIRRAQADMTRRAHQSGTRGRGFGGTEVAMLILIAHTGKTVELEYDETSR